MDKQKLNESAVLPALPEWTKFDDLGGKVPSEIRTAFNAHAREAWTMGLDYGMEHAPAADETTLPDLARLLGTASKEGNAVKLSHIAAGTLYNAMSAISPNAVLVAALKEMIDQHVNGIVGISKPCIERARAALAAAGVKP